MLLRPEVPALSALPRRCVATAHIALPAALAAHTLPEESSQWAPANSWVTPMGYDLAWRLEVALDGCTGSGQCSSLHASAALLMRASAGSLVSAAGGCWRAGKAPANCAHQKRGLRPTGMLPGGRML